MVVAMVVLGSGYDHHGYGPYAVTHPRHGVPGRCCCPDRRAKKAFAEQQKAYEQAVAAQRQYTPGSANNVDPMVSMDARMKSMQEEDGS
ncbi:hypothetical protein [endosymbiont of Lamellibrachia barhami]|uniref:hypothetical protein n=1 Tax=endosymbiont of Lamellibrachia barhami TaxID=205975 RepID=UPI0015B0D741|nr:hypothetical protein [endosymbiont of Lamellibrachia barhami]